MNASLFLWAAGIALAFVAWPILGSKSGVPGAWMGILILIGSVIGNTIVGTKDIIESPLFTWKAFVIVVMAGIVNGIAVYYYGAKSADPNIPTGIFVTTMVVCMVVFAPFVDYFVKGTTISLKEIAGIAVICLGIYIVKS